nr:MAG TPA: hypothetical protein [Herelleviridae sp.]
MTGGRSRLLERKLSTIQVLKQVRLILRMMKSKSM